MKRNFLNLTLLLFGMLLCCTTVSYGKNEKKKKNRKEFVWEKPSEMTGIKDFDTYILTCDTLWNRITTYRDSIHFFQIDTVKVIDKTTNTPYYDIQIRDEEGTKRNWLESIKQGTDMVLTGTNIVLDAANITLMTATATTSLTENPLVAFTHGKYLKAGPRIVKLAYDEVKEIVSRTKVQTKQMREIHKSKIDKSTDTDYLVPIPEDVEINLEECVDMATLDMGESSAQDLPEDLLNADLDSELEIPEE